jgi:hypothetical protein
MRHIRLGLVLASAVAVLAAPASASAAVSGKGNGYSLRLGARMGTLIVPASQVSSGAQVLWTVECARTKSGKPRMVMGVSPVTPARRKLIAPVGHQVASGSICNVQRDQQVVAIFRVRR